MKAALDFGQTQPVDGLENLAILADGLQTSSILRPLPQDFLLQIAAKTQQKVLEEGDVLCHQGDIAHSVWLVLDGWLKMTRETLDGGEAVWDVMGPGHIAGIETMTHPYCYTTRVVAVSCAVVLVIPHHILRKRVEVEPEFAMNLLGHALRQQQHDRLELEHRTHQTAPQRIGCFLLKLAGTPVEGKVSINLPFDKGLLAARLGMQPETFSRALVKLRSETGLVLDGTRVTILDVARLEYYTCAACTGNYPHCEA